MEIEPKYIEAIKKAGVSVEKLGLSINKLILQSKINRNEAERKKSKYHN